MRLCVNVNVCVNANANVCVNVSECVRVRVCVCVCVCVEEQGYDGRHVAPRASLPSPRGPCQSGLPNEKL